MESKAADLFAFGMVVAEVMTGKLPFEEMSDSGAALRISKGERPELPEYTQDNGLTPQLRELVQKCWDQDPAKRPTIDEVVATLKALEEGCVQRVPNDGNHGRIVPDTVEPPDESRLVLPPVEAIGQPPPPSKHLSPSLDVGDLRT